MRYAFLLFLYNAGRKRRHPIKAPERQAVCSALRRDVQAVVLQ
ncbi:hypothetical protein HMPREF0239_02465 [Clostridium sp. ATCC BAA-442]|nr:hypothetical protein HMPREF0239_02465 [Clostridium sp. ATCC BAA-442]